MELATLPLAACKRYRHRCNGKAGASGRRCDPGTTYRTRPRRSIWSPTPTPLSRTISCRRRRPSTCAHSVRRGRVGLSISLATCFLLACQTLRMKACRRWTNKNALPPGGGSCQVVSLDSFWAENNLPKYKKNLPHKNSNIKTDTILKVEFRVFGICTWQILAPVI